MRGGWDGYWKAKWRGSSKGGSHPTIKSSMPPVKMFKGTTGVQNTMLWTPTHPLNLEHCKKINRKILQLWRDRSTIGHKCPGQDIWNRKQQTSESGSPGQDIMSWLRRPGQDIMSQLRLDTTSWPGRLSRDMMICVLLYFCPFVCSNVQWSRMFYSKVHRCHSKRCHSKYFMLNSLCIYLI